MSEELKPCPFCGGDPGKAYVGPMSHHYVMCNACGANVYAFTSKAHAEKCWNRRDIEDALKARAESTEARFSRLDDEYTETQEAIAELAEAMGIDAEARWDHDSCPNNSAMIRELIGEFTSIKSRAEQDEAKLARMRDALLAVVCFVDAYRTFDLTKPEYRDRWRETRGRAQASLDESKVPA